MAYTAVHRHARISARKVRPLADLIRGKSVDEAFSGAFSMQVSELEEALRAYIRRVSFHYNSYKRCRMMRCCSSSDSCS